MDYQLLDSGNLQKLEKVGQYTVIRSAPQANYKPKLAKTIWDEADAVFNRSEHNAGYWQWKDNQNITEWIINFSGINILVKPTKTGQLGFFPEHLITWGLAKKNITEKVIKEHSILSLFAYTGVGSLLLSKTGTKICHVDSAKEMVKWGQKSLDLNPSIPNNIRWITDDVIKFLEREVKRGNKYNSMIFDPPSFGKGTKNTHWQISKDIHTLLELIKKVFNTENPGSIIFTCHSPKFEKETLVDLLQQYFPTHKKIHSQNMIIPSPQGNSLRCGDLAMIEF